MIRAQQHVWRFYQLFTVKKSLKNSNFTFCARPRAGPPPPREISFDLSTANSFFSRRTAIFTCFSLYGQKTPEKKSHFCESWKEKREKFESNFEWERGAIGGTQTDEAPKINNAPHGLTWHYTVWIEPFMRIFYSEKATFWKFWTSDVWSKIFGKNGFSSSSQLVV